MKADDGSLGYISGLALAIQAEASAADPALNAAIQLLNGGEVYTVARVSCFRDNLVPRSDMSLAIHTNAGNWRDSGDTRWLSPANESARQYVVGVCRELAALGFDEILLDNWAFPTDGELGWIKADANYPADGRTAALEVFLEEVRAGLAEFPEVKVSLVTTASAAAGGRWRAARPPLCWSAPTAYWCAWGGDPAPAERDPGGARAGAGGQAREDWAVLAMTGE
ncbi:putative glycoside hydrolase [Flavonifractor plautii]|nr:putative glycoside hydrolase [Flavonifractor plautii]